MLRSEERLSHPSEGESVVKWAMNIYRASEFIYKTKCEAKKSNLASVHGRRRSDAHPIMRVHSWCCASLFGARSRFQQPVKVPCMFSKPDSAHQCGSFFIYLSLSPLKHQHLSPVGPSEERTLQPAPPFIFFKARVFNIGPLS